MPGYDEWALESDANVEADKMSFDWEMINHDPN